jgi:enoyl-CoA hydratase/carnithine racemase
MEAGPVRFSLEDDQAPLTIDRAEARSALSAEVVAALEAAAELLVAELSVTLTTEDAAEGVLAFLSQRPPEWKDR